MAVVPHVAGASLVRISRQEDEALIDLGYTRNMVSIVHTPYFLDVPSDRFGGDDGPPVDIVYLGESSRIRLELTEWDQTALDLVKSRVPGTAGAPKATTGLPYIPGTLIFTQDLAMRLAIDGASTFDAVHANLNFPRVVPRNPIEFGMGSKYTSVIVEFDAYQNTLVSNSGVLYNQTVA